MSKLRVVGPGENGDERQALCVVGSFGAITRRAAASLKPQPLREKAQIPS
jgi:hypothetical protein